MHPNVSLMQSDGDKHSLKEAMATLQPKVQALRYWTPMEKYHSDKIGEKKRLYISMISIPCCELNLFSVK